MYILNQVTKIFLLLLFCISANHTQAQIAIEWQKCLGGTNIDEGKSVVQTKDGGYVVAGYTWSFDGDVTGNHGTVDYWVVKLDGSGNMLWQQCYGGASNDVARSILETIDGGYVVFGNTNSNNGQVTGNHGGGDCWVVKLDSLGILQWQKCLGGILGDFAGSIKQTNDGGYVLAGYTNSNDGDVSGNHGVSDMWLVKLDSSGVLQWQKCFGGTDSDYAQSVDQTNDGGYVVAGWTNSNDGDVTGNHGGSDYWILKIDGFGNLQWQQCLGGTANDVAYSVEQTTDGGYVVSGRVYSNDGDVTGNHGNYDYWIVKLDAGGNILWQNCLGGTNSEEAVSVRQTFDGGYIIAGWSSSNDGNISVNFGGWDYWLIKLDSQGNIQWQKCLGGTDAEQREQIRALTEKESDAIIVGSYGTFSTGVNIRNLHNIIFASPSKSRVRNLQSIGRGLRISSTKEACNLYDIGDDLSWKKKKNFTLQHMVERIKIYNEESFKYSLVKVDIND
jgi:hypothetical protein